MSEGGGIKDDVKAVEEGAGRFAKKVWWFGHNNQIASHAAHWSISALGSIAAALLLDEPLDPEVGYMFGAFIMMVLYGIRELGDARAHRKAGDWKTVDHDKSWSGKDEEGEDAEYDGWDDWLAPAYNFATSVLVALVLAFLR